LLIAQLADFHVTDAGKLLIDRWDTRAALDRAVKRIASLDPQPDLVVVSGDLGEDGTPDEYAFVGEKLRSLSRPVLAVPGNHDRRETLLAALPDMLSATPSGHLCHMTEQNGLVLIGLDTLVEGAGHGELCDQRLAWLEDTLTRTAGRARLLVMHHPPFQTGITSMDAIGLRRGLQELAALLTAYPGTQAILCGHVHRSIQSTFAGIPVRLAPSASHAIACDLRPGAGYRLVREPPQVMLHIWSPSAGLVSHSVYVDDYPPL
jgi:Icc protein